MTCTARGFHIPPQPAPDHHHVIPRAWQHFWSPAVADQVALRASLPNPLAGAVAGLWDPRTVELCPNCHRGVHERIVALMHDKPKGRDRLWNIAQLALDRFIAAGGSLDALRAARQWGEQ